MSPEGTVCNEYFDYLSQDQKSECNRPHMTLAKGKGACEKVGNQPNQSKRKRMVKEERRKKGSSLNTKYLQITQFHFMHNWHNWQPFLRERERGRIC
jgi:hypothetical protein